MRVNWKAAFPTAGFNRPFRQTSDLTTLIKPSVIGYYLFNSHSYETIYLNYTCITSSSNTNTCLFLNSNRMT